MSRQKTMICFGAHPDDETFGMGSTLALCITSGVKVYYVCSTGGEAGTVAPEFLKGYSSIADLRRDEMKCAAQVLGLTDVFYLGYRDSGMPGSEDNKHPAALAAAPVAEVAGRMVKIIRQVKPDVVITHNARGGYGHPDHIATHHAAVKAFHAAGDPGQYAEAGEAFQPFKLYFSIRPRSMTMRLMIKVMPLFGQDLHHFGRNRDIDMTKAMDPSDSIHAVIRVTRQARQIRARAAACHASQGGGQIRRGPFLFRVMEKLSRRRDYFTRGYPPPTKRREKDLFAGIPS